MTATQSTAAAPERRRTRTSARDLAQIAVFAALIAALGLPGAIYLGGTAVPITFQTLGVMLAGAILGARKGALSVLLCSRSWRRASRCSRAAGRHRRVRGALGGVPRRLGARRVRRRMAHGALAPALPRAPGPRRDRARRHRRRLPHRRPGVRREHGPPLGAAIAGSAIFLPGDILKVVVTVLVAKGVHRAWPGLIAPAAWPVAPCGGDPPSMSEWLHGTRTGSPWRSAGTPCATASSPERSTQRYSRQGRARSDAAPAPIPSTS